MCPLHEPSYLRTREGACTHAQLPPHATRPRSRDRIRANADLDFTIPPAAMARIAAIQTRQRFVQPATMWGIDVFAGRL